MLAGLIFAVKEADDRSGMLAATLPFAGVTLIEFQARLLVAAGASQIIVVGARVTPELVGAVARIGRRGVSVDTVRSAVEASAKLHPLARLVVLADGLVTTDEVIATFAREGRDAILVTDAAAASDQFERIGGGLAWAGVARVDARRLEEVAQMPRDYDVQSALLHAAGQANAAHVALPASSMATGHGIERRAAALEERSRGVMMATLAMRPAWFDRWIVRPLAGLVLPPLMRRGGSTLPIALGVGVATTLGLGLVAAGYAAIGLVVALSGVIAAIFGERAAWLRDEVALARGFAIATAAVPAFAMLLLGRSIDLVTATDNGAIVAVVLVAIAALAERGAGVLQRAAWWATIPSYLLLVTLFTIIRMPMLGLGVAAGYATITLAGVIEALRRKA